MNPGSLTKVFSVIEQSFKASTKKHAKNKEPFISLSPSSPELHKFPEKFPIRTSVILRHCKGQRLSCKKAHISPEYNSAHMIICQRLCQTPSV